MIRIPKLDSIVEERDDSWGYLTYGVELEFLVPSVRHHDRDPDPDVTDRELFRTHSDNPAIFKPLVREKLMDILRKYGKNCSQAADDTYYPPHNSVVMYNNWRLVPENLLRKFTFSGPNSGPYVWTDCELTSPVMSQNQYADQIDGVCWALRTVRIHLNQSTSVHVHVGRDDKPFSLLTLKKFVTLYWFTEDSLMGLQHPSRRFNSYCFRLRKYSVLALKKLEHLELEMKGKIDPMMFMYVPDKAVEAMSLHNRARLLRIWASDSMDDIAELMADEDGERGSVGFRRFMPAGPTGGNIETFEWRQMAGTLDADHINSWVQVCVEFTDFCRRARRERFGAMICEAVRRDGGYTGIHLLRELGIDTYIFEEMLQVWECNSEYFDGPSGKELFVPRSQNWDADGYLRLCSDKKMAS